MSQDTILKVINISKSFPGTKALSNVALELKKGETHAIVGENGAGKSTLMNIISGFYKQDEGSVELFGKKVNFNNPLDSQKAGIGIVHQEMANCPQISVAENIYMSAINNNKMRFVNYSKLYNKTEEILKVFNLNIKANQKVSRLNISEQQVVEIAKALSLDCHIIIFDEPTASLTEMETETLFSIIGDLKAKGISILYISHRMAEVFNHCDRATVLKDGKKVETVVLSEVDISYVINRMVGRDIGDFYPVKNTRKKETFFEARGFTRKGYFKGISFKVRQGEILGIAGLVGSRRTEVVRTICGIDHKDSGNVQLNGKHVPIRSYKHSIQNGIVYLTEDRKVEGLFLRMSIKLNISALDIKQV
jgi:ribose transport system ATP-binding protein